jgi:carbohydrate kinase (thermoresistant glucokinase family)
VTDHGAPSLPPIVVMGVAGSGKTTVGTQLAQRLGVPFLEGDGLHPPANVAKMAAGHPLDDDDRRPWLTLIGEWLADGPPGPGGGVAACSALARRYRDLLRGLAPETWFLHLDARRSLVARRVARRRGHFMPATLVDSQLQALEPLAPDERGLRVDASGPVAAVLDAAVAALTRAAG